MNAKTAEKSKPEDHVTDLPPVPQNVFGLKESHNPGYWVCLPHGFTVEHLKQPHMWANIAGTGTLRPYSTIEVFTVDHSEVAIGYIKQVGRNWANVKFPDKWHVKLDSNDPLPQNRVKFIVVELGPVDRFCLVNADTKETVRKGFASELDALRFKAEYERTIGGA